MPNTTVKKWLTGLAIVVLVLGLAEIAVSSYAEKMLANVLLANARIRTRPDVAFKSFPNIAKLPTGHSGDLLINLNDGYKAVESTSGRKTDNPLKATPCKTTSLEG